MTTAIQQDIQEQIDPAWVKKNKVPFARAGVFNPYTLADWDKIAKKMHQGYAPALDKEFWFLDRWLSHPVRLLRTRGKLVRVDRIRWRFSLTQSQLYLTPHALARFRERSGRWINPETQCWDIPHISRGVELDARQMPITSYMLPTVGGAWLGYCTLTANSTGTEDYTYSRKKGLNLQLEDPLKHFNSFYALTYISENQMTLQQIDAVTAYAAGDYAVFDKLNREMAIQHPTSIF